MKKNDGRLLRSIVLRDVLQEQDGMEQKRSKFEQSIVNPKKRASKDANKRSSAMRSVFEATRSPSKAPKKESRLHETGLVTSKVSEKKQENTPRLIFKLDLENYAPKGKKPDIFERKRRKRDGNAVWTLLGYIKKQANISRRAVSLRLADVSRRAMTFRLNSPFKKKHQKVLSQLSIAHHGKNRLS